MNNHGLLIFDLDGTLFRTETVTLPAVQSSLQEQGLPIPPDEEIYSFIGEPSSKFQAWLSSHCWPENVSELISIIDQREIALIPETGELYPRVQEVLTTLRTFVTQMAIFSNGTPEYVEKVINAHGLKRFFDEIRCRRSDQDTKALMLRELLEHLGGRPAIVIGDRYHDIKAARQNGLLVIATTYGYGMEEEWILADATVDSPSDLPDLIRPLLEGETPE